MGKAGWIGIVLVLAGLLGCSETQEHSRKEQSCSPGTRFCFKGHAIATCGEAGKPVIEQICAFTETCEQSTKESPLSCHPLPLSLEIHQPILQVNTTVAAFFPTLEKERNKSLASMVNAFFYHVDPAKGANVSAGRTRVPALNQVGLDERGRTAMMLSLVYEFMAELKKIATPDSPIARFADSTIKVVDTENDTDIRLQYESKNEEPNKILKTLPSTSFTVILTTKQIPAPQGGTILLQERNKNIGVNLYVLYRSHHHAVNMQVRPAMVRMSESARFALSAFYLTGQYGGLKTVYQQDEFENILLSTFPRLVDHRYFWACTEPCHKAFKDGLPILQRVAKQALVKGKRVATLSAQEIENLQLARPALVGLVLAEELSRRGKLARALAPIERFGFETIRAILFALDAGTPYADTVFMLASTIQPKGGKSWLALGDAKREDLLQLVAPLKKGPLTDSFRAILPIWAKVDSIQSIKFLMDHMDTLAKTARDRHMILTTIAKYGRSAVGPFLLRHLEKGETTKQALRFLLFDKKSRSLTERVLRTKLKTFDLLKIRVVLSSLEINGMSTSKSLVKAIRLLHDETPDFLIYFETFAYLKRRNNQDWNWPQRPPIVDTYLREYVAQADKADVFNQAKNAYNHLTPAGLVSLYRYGLSLPEKKNAEIKHLLDEILKTFPELNGTRDRVARCHQTPRVANLAKPVLKKP